MQGKHKHGQPNPRAKRPQIVLSRKQDAGVRAREATSARVDQFIRVDFPVRLREHPGIHNVGHIEGDGGRVLTLTRCDIAAGAAADRRFERSPSIVLAQKTSERTAEIVAVLTPPAAGALGLVLDGRWPQTSDQTEADDTASNTSRAQFQGWPVGAVVIACPPHPLPAHAHLVGLVSTLDDDTIMLIRGEDGGVSIVLPRDFVAHLSLAATEALAQVLQEFAQAHGIDVTKGNFAALESVQETANADPT